MRDSYMRMGQGFLLVYSITSRQSFTELDSFAQQILRVKDVDRAPMVVVGNKSDLEVGILHHPILRLQGERQIYAHEGAEYAKRIGCPFIETSAKCNTNVDLIFEQITREIRATTVMPGVHRLK